MKTEKREARVGEKVLTIANDQDTFSEYEKGEVHVVEKILIFGDVFSTTPSPSPMYEGTNVLILKKDYEVIIDE